MLAPVQEQISEDLSIQQGYQWILVNSLILIGVGLGPLILAPVSEMYGRRPALLGGSALFIIWNTGCGFAQSLSQMLAFRLLAGFGACAADAVAGGVLGDLWAPHERGRAFAVYMAAPLLGPGVGPIIGAYIATGTSWRWVFWITSIASASVLLIAVVFLRESFDPTLICADQEDDVDLKTPIEGPEERPKKDEGAYLDFMSLLWTHLQRPFRMLATQVIIQLIAMYMALLYGTMFLFLYMYAILWTKSYGQSVRTGSLNYISAAIGYIMGVQSECKRVLHLHFIFPLPE